MADDTLTIHIDEAGRITVEGLTALRRLASRPGRYRLVPSASRLVILERLDNGSGAEGATHHDGHVLFAGEVEAIGGLVDMIHFVSNNRWSGHFAVLDGTVRKTIYFKQGDVSTAASNVPEDRIGAILYRYGMITAQELERTLSQVTEEHRFGQILVENGTLTAHALYQFVRRQIEEIFHSVLTLRRGEYYFYRTADEAGPPSQLQLSTQTLLFEGVRRIDEMSYFRQKIPSNDVVLVRNPQASEKLPPRETRVLGLIDGQRDVGAVARASHLGEFEATKLLFQMLCSGHIYLRPPLAPSSQPSDSTIQVIDTFNQAYAKVYATVAGRGKLPALERGLRSFFQSVTDFAPLFVGIDISPDGTLPREALLNNLEIAPTDHKLDYLYRGLNELLFFELFTAGEGVDRHAELELHQRLNQILRDMPRTGGSGDGAV